MWSLSCRWCVLPLDVFQHFSHRDCRTVLRPVSACIEQLRQILESPRNGIWYEAKAWVTTRTARFTALTSSLDADDAFTVIPKKNSKTAKKGSGESATGDSLDSAFATLAQINEDFAVQRSKITQAYKALMSQAHDRSSNQNVSNRKR